MLEFRALSPSLGSLALREANCHVIKEPCAKAHVGELGRASSEAHQQAQSEAQGRACPIKPEMPAALA